MGLHITPAHRLVRIAGFKVAQANPERMQWLLDAIKFFQQGVQHLRTTLNPQVRGVNAIVNTFEQIKALQHRTDLSDEVITALLQAFEKANATINKLQQENADDPQQYQEIFQAIQSALSTAGVAPQASGQTGQAPGAASATTSGQIPPMQGDPQTWLQATTQALNAVQSDPSMLSNLSVQLNNMASQAPDDQWKQALNSASQQAAQMLASNLSHGTTTEPGGQVAWNFGTNTQPQGAAPAPAPAPAPAGAGAGAGAGTVADPNAQQKGRGFTGWLGRQIGRVPQMRDKWDRNFQQGFDYQRSQASMKPRLTAMMGSSHKYRFARKKGMD